MANKKLFEELEVVSTTSDTDRLAFGKAGSTYKNITMLDFKTELFGGSGGPLQQVALEIGSWDMNTDETTTVNVESSPGVQVLLANMRGVSSILIQNNIQSAFWEFSSDGTGTASSLPQIVLLGLSGGFAQVALQIRVNSIFRTNAVFNDPGINRGWVVVNYV